MTPDINLTLEQCLAIVGAIMIILIGLSVFIRMLDEAPIEDDQLPMDEERGE